MTFRFIHYLRIFQYGCFIVMAAALGNVTADAQLPPATAPAAGYQFEFNAPAGTKLTSAGIYNAQGDPVRTLWSLQPTAAGSQTRQWDGADDLGRPLPTQPYTFKIAIGVDAANIGMIGNTGIPTTTFGHVPVNFESVAVNARGEIFTVHDWDEAGFDVIEWSPETGRSLRNSGHHINGILKAIAADDDSLYVTTYQDAAKAKTAKFYVYTLKLTPAGIKLSKFTVAGPAIKVYDGNVIYPQVVPPQDLGLVHIPLQSIAVHGPTLYVTDALAGLVRMYDKVTGEARGDFPVSLPRSVAVAPDGTVWVAHSHHEISAFRPDGTSIGTPITDAADIAAITFDPRGDLYVADRGANVVRRYKITNGQPALVSALGAPAQPGDRAPDHFYQLRGVAVDRAGNIITIQDEFFFNGGRLAKFSPDGKSQWEQMGLEFQSAGTYGSDDPNTFYSMMHHAYHLDRATGTAKYLGNTVDGELYRGNNINGVPRVLHMGSKDFYYMPTGDGVEIFEIDPPASADAGPVFKLASAIAGNQPLPSGTNAERAWERKNFYLWSWHDVNGDHTPTQATIALFCTPATRRTLWQHGPMDVDADGNIWFASYDRGGLTVERNAIYEIPLAGIDARGNPIYTWNNAKRVFTDGSGWKIQFRTAVHAAGGLTYVYGDTQTYPNLGKSGGLFMGGNVLLGYAGNQQKWLIPLKQVAVGLEVAPPASSSYQGGVLIGAEPWKGGIYYYTADGLLISKMYPSAAMGRKPNVPTGCLDAYSAISANRDPKTGMLDVFVQDDYNDRILWYQIADQRELVISGPVKPAAPASATSDRAKG